MGFDLDEINRIGERGGSGRFLYLWGENGGCSEDRSNHGVGLVDLILPLLLGGGGGSLIIINVRWVFCDGVGRRAIDLVCCCVSLSCFFEFQVLVIYACRDVMSM